MIEAPNKQVWLLVGDRLLMDETNLYLQADYRASDFSQTELWRRNEPYPLDKGRLVYKMPGSRFDRLDSYDFYPASASVPVVTDRMKAAVLQLCGPEQVAFHPCEIRTKKGDVRTAWNLYPLNYIWCVDREKTIAAWKTSTLRPEVVWLGYTEHLVFKPDCLGSLHIARLRESMGYIVVSDELKQVMEAVNPKGMKFLAESDAVIGSKPIDWDAIRNKH